MADGGDSSHAPGPSGSPERLTGVTSQTAENSVRSQTAAHTWLSAHPRLAALIATIADVVVKQSNYRLSLSAAGAAFWLVITIFPAVFAAIMIFGLVVSQEQINSWLDRARGQSSDGLASVVAEQAQQVVQTEPSTLSIGLIISLALTLWSASAGTYALLRSVRLAYGLAPEPYVVARARGVLGTLIAVVGLGTFGWLAATTRDMVVGMDGVKAVVVGLVSSAVVLLVLVAAVAGTFRFAIAAPTPRRCVIPGAVLTTVAIGLLVVGAALFGSYVGRFQATYGALTSVVVTLFVLYGLMYVTLLAALFNALWAPLPAHEAAVGETPDPQRLKWSDGLSGGRPGPVPAAGKAGLSSGTPVAEGQPGTPT